MSKPYLKENIKLNKLDIAERQIKLAIRLFFEEKDYVSIHTLAGAAHSILYDIAKTEGIQSIFIDSKIIKPDKRKYVNDIFKKPQNFFKHADKDPDATIEFKPMTSIFYLFDAGYIYYQITKKQIPEFSVLFAWLFTLSPDIIDIDQMEDPNSKKILEECLKGFDPYDFGAILSVIDFLHSHSS